MKVTCENRSSGFIYIIFVLGFLMVNLGVGLGKSAGAIAQAAPTDTTAINKQNEYAFTLWSQNPDSLILLSKETLLKSEQIQYAAGKMNAYINLGAGYYEKGDYNKAISFYQKGIELAQQTGDYTKEAKSMSSMTNAFIALGLHDEALKYLYLALDIAEKHNLKRTVGHILHNIGMVYHYQMKVDQAISFYEKSKAHYEALGDSINNTFILGNIGHLYLKKKDYKNAQQHYQHSLRLARFFKNSKAISNALISLGKLNSELGDDTEALKYYEKAKTVSESTGERTEYLRLLNNMSDSYINLKQIEQAEWVAKLGYEMASQQGQLYYSSTSAELLSKIYEKKGNHQAALKYYKLFKSNQDSLDNKSNREALIRLEEKYRFEKSKEKIESDHYSVLNRKQNQLYLATLVIMSLIIVSILLYIFFVQKRKANAALRKSKSLIEKEFVNLDKSNKFKKQLISIMAHDIRGPIANVKMILMLDVEGDLSPKLAKELNNASQVELDAMIAALDNLLLWITDQLQNKIVTKAYVDLAVVVQQMLDLYNMQATKKGIHMNVQIAENVQVYVDLESLKIVLRNLIYNAIKFCHQDDEITITASVVPGSEHIDVHVVDTGMGMSAAVIASILSNDGYSQLGTHNEKGTGLGLQICREYTKVNGSELFVKSSLGEGSEFWFSLPLDASSPLGTPL